MNTINLQRKCSKINDRVLCLPAHNGLVALSCRPASEISGLLNVAFGSPHQKRPFREVRLGNPEMVGRERSLGRVQRDERNRQLHTLQSHKHCAKRSCLIFRRHGLALVLGVVGFSPRRSTRRLRWKSASQTSGPARTASSAHVRTGDKVTAKYAGARCRKEGCRGRRTALFKYSRHAYPSFG